MITSTFLSLGLSSSISLRSMVSMRCDMHFLLLRSLEDNHLCHPKMTRIWQENFFLTMWREDLRLYSGWCGRWVVLGPCKVSKGVSGVLYVLRLCMGVLQENLPIKYLASQHLITHRYTHMTLQNLCLCPSETLTQPHRSGWRFLSIRSRENPLRHW